MQLKVNLLCECKTEAERRETPIKQLSHRRVHKYIIHANDDDDDDDDDESEIKTPQIVTFSIEGVSNGYFFSNCVSTIIPSEEEINLQKQLSIQRVSQQIEIEYLQHKQKMEEMNIALAQITERSLSQSDREMMTNWRVFSEDIISESQVQAISFTNAMAQGTDVRKQLNTQEVHQQIESEAIYMDHKNKIKNYKP